MAVSISSVVMQGALFVGLFAVISGLATALRPQGMIDATCRISPFCASPMDLSPAGRTYNRALGVGLAVVGVLLIAGSDVGTFS
jgi:hypothetical protein